VRLPLRQRLAVCVALLLAATAAASALPRTAHAGQIRVTDQGTAGHPFAFVTPLASTLELVTGSDQNQHLSLSWGLLGRIDFSSSVYSDMGAAGPLADPRSVQGLANGDVLFTDRTADLVAETTPAGKTVWTYTKSDDPNLERPFSAQRFIAKDGRQLTLIADRMSYRVFAVNDQKKIVWQYGTTGTKGLGVDQLEDPFCATYDKTSDAVLIADNNGASRVIDVRWSDYRAGAAPNGFSEKSIIWSYGTPGVSGSEPGLLMKPRSPERLLTGPYKGDVLIADADASDAMIVDWTTKQIEWRYGVAGVAGTVLDHLNQPTYAEGLANGDILITDTGNQRLLRVPVKGGTPAVHDMSVLGRPPWVTASDAGEPRGATLAPDGSLFVADSAFGQITRFGRAARAVAVSSPLDCGRPGKKKAFVKLTWSGDVSAAGSAVAVDYKIDSGSWRTCSNIGAVRSYSFPKGTVGTLISYRVTLSTTNRETTPILNSIHIQTTVPTSGGSGGGGGGTTSGSGDNSGSSGTYTYPGAVGGTGTSGTGTGSGSAGSGSGSGAAGSGSGSTAASGVGSSSTAKALEVPAESSGSGASQSVSGYQVQGEQGVSGVPLKSAKGAQVAAQDAPGPALPVGTLVCAGVIVLGAFFVPWPVMAARLRRVTGFDHVRPRYHPPFWPLGR
jgi:hypothetical protein